MELTPPLAAGIPVHCAHHEIVSIHGLKPHPSNPNKHPERQLAIYAEAIRQHGWREAITVEYQDYESDAAELADLLAHNRLASLSQTDGDVLKTVLTQLGGAGCQLVTGAGGQSFFRNSATEQRDAQILREKYGDAIQLGRIGGMRKADYAGAVKVTLKLPF